MADKAQLVKKIKALAERGESGESENAAALLRELMKKYNVTEADLCDDKQKHHINKTSEATVHKAIDVDFFDEFIKPSAESQNELDDAEFFREVILGMAASKGKSRIYRGTSKSIKVSRNEKKIP